MGIRLVGEVRCSFFRRMAPPSAMVSDPFHYLELESLDRCLLFTHPSFCFLPIPFHSVLISSPSQNHVESLASEVAGLRTQWQHRQQEREALELSLLQTESASSTSSSAGEGNRKRRRMVYPAVQA